MDRLTTHLPDGQTIMDCKACENSWCEKHPGQKRGDCTALYCRNRLKNRVALYEDVLEKLEQCGYSLERLGSVADLLLAGQSVVMERSKLC